MSDPFVCNIKQKDQIVGIWTIACVHDPVSVSFLRWTFSVSFTSYIFTQPSAISFNQFAVRAEL